MPFQARLLSLSPDAMCHHISAVFLCLENFSPQTSPKSFFASHQNVSVPKEGFVFSLLHKPLPATPPLSLIPPDFESAHLLRLHYVFRTLVDPVEK